MTTASGGLIVQHPRVLGQRLGHPCSESAWCALGVLAAALVFELMLRPFVAGWNQPVGPVRTIRSYFEGTSVAHFEPDGLVLIRFPE